MPEHSIRSKSIHQKLKQIETIIESIRSDIAGAKNLSDTEKRHYDLSFEAIRRMCIAQCPNDDPTEDYYPEFD